MRVGRAWLLPRRARLGVAMTKPVAPGRMASEPARWNPDVAADGCCGGGSEGVRVMCRVDGGACQRRARLFKLRAMRIRRRQTPAEEFQMAPMIDMVFLLLVFFMCVSSLSQAERAMPVELPASTESKVPEQLADRASISILADGTCYVGAERADDRLLAERVRGAMAANPRTRLHVRADGAVRFDVIRRVLRICAEAGAYDVIYSTHQES